MNESNQGADEGTHFKGKESHAIAWAEHLFKEADRGDWPELQAISVLAYMSNAVVAAQPQLGQVQLPATPAWKV
jgi:hypothetical protein